MSNSNVAIVTDLAGNPVSASPATTLATGQSSVVQSGSDYAATPKAQIPKVDAAGSQYVAPVSPGGNSIYVYNGQTPPAASSQFGSQIMALQTLPTPIYLPLTLDPTGSLNVHEKSKATARYIQPSVVGAAAGKSMFSIFNGSTATVLRIQQINIQTPYMYSTGNSLLGLTGQYNVSVMMLMELRRMTGHTSKGATTATVAYALSDTADAAQMDPGIVAYSNATIAGTAAAPFHRADANSPSGLPWYLRGDVNQKTLNLRPGEGMTINTVTNTASVTFELEIVVTTALA